MLPQASVSYHLDLYRYWLSKRGSRSMPARRDINPGDIRPLLPYLTIIDRVDGKLRYRLVGSEAAQQIGRDLTGRLVGFYLNQPEIVAHMRAIYERVLATAHPFFATAEYKTTWGSFHHVSQLMLPLSDDGVDANMIVFARVARFNFNAPSGADWLKGVPVRICDVVQVDDVKHIEQRCLDWERRCLVSAAHRETG
jgi:hypothetical protein